MAAEERSGLRVSQQRSRQKHALIHTGFYSAVKKSCIEKEVDLEPGEYDEISQI